MWIILWCVWVMIGDGDDVRRCVNEFGVWCVKVNVVRC